MRIADAHLASKEGIIDSMKLVGVNYEEMKLNSKRLIENANLPEEIKDAFNAGDFPSNSPPPFHLIQTQKQPITNPLFHRQHKAWGVSPRYTSGKNKRSPRSGRQPNHHD